MRMSVILAFGAVALSTAPALADTPRAPSDYVAAIADQHRPSADRAKDPERKPAETLAFIGVKPGDKVADVVSGGYFTRLFSSAVGARGKLYAVQLAEMVTRHPEALTGLKLLTSDPVYSNVVVTSPPSNGFTAPEPLDVVFIRQDYHDLNDKFMAPADLAMFNKAVFAALKPGGVYVVLDHAAQAGSGLSATETLHRIDPEAVKSEVTAAGFVFEAESSILRNPADPKTAMVFDPSIRGRTDQFLFRFRKPAK